MPGSQRDQNGSIEFNLQIITPIKFSFPRHQDASQTTRFPRLWRFLTFAPLCLCPFAPLRPRLVHIINFVQKNFCTFVKNKIFFKFLSSNLTNTYDFYPKKICENFVKIVQVFSKGGETYKFINR